MCEKLFLFVNAEPWSVVWKQSPSIDICLFLHLEFKVTARRRSFAWVKLGTVDLLENSSDSFAIFILISCSAFDGPKCNFSALLQLVAMVSSNSTFIQFVWHAVILLKEKLHEGAKERQDYHKFAHVIIKKHPFCTIYTGDFHFCTNTYFKAFSFQPLEIHETVAECMIFANHWVAKKIAESFPSTALVRISCNGCYCSCVCKRSSFCFQLHTDEAKWVNTMETDPLAFKTGITAIVSPLCTCVHCQLPYTEPNCLSF